MRNKLRFLSLLLIALAGLTMNGCYMFRTPVMPYYAGSYTNIGGPVDITFKGKELGDRVGKASSFTVMGLVAFGDCSTHQAASNGQIQEIDQVDFEFVNILGVFGKYTTIVTGKGGQGT